MSDPTKIVLATLGASLLLSAFLFVNVVLA
jgi:hypothetical protein